jgi:hypothetical protein
MEPVQIENIEKKQVSEGLRLIWKELNRIHDIEAISNGPEKN